MRILIFSDTHENISNIELVVKNEGKFDKAFFCGDGAGDCDYFESRLNCPVWRVNGNNDFFTGARSAIDTEIEGKKIHMEHGHRLHCYDIQNLCYAAEANKWDVLLFGHTHRCLIYEDQGRFIVNPGSLYQPRDGQMPSYIVMETDGQGNFTFTPGHI
ncbi:MAG: metallophosphoesterase [Lachnospiraceae bacterium]|nr:metallophosphoesterase [Lachnospiraceae bacterium]